MTQQHSTSLGGSIPPEFPQEIIRIYPFGKWQNARPTKGWRQGASTGRIIAATQTVETTLSIGATTMSGAQEQRREGHIEMASAELDSQLAPYRTQQSQLREQIAKSKAQTEELQQQLDAVTKKIGEIMDGSLWWKLYEKD